MMITIYRSIAALTLAASSVGVLAQSTASTSACSTSITPSYAAPSVAAGYEARLIATNLTKPRSVLFDANGNLLVVQQGKGIVSLNLTDNGGACLSVGTSHDVILDSSLTHGIALSRDGRTLYASSPEAVFSWAYDPASSRNSSGPSVIVNNMNTSDHTTRTLLLPNRAPGMLVVTRGSTSNLDLETLDVSTGHSQVKAFNLTNTTATYNFDTDGLLMGWGLRNEVGVAEEPLTGGIWGVENSVDNLMRDGQDIHQNNPGEELNFLGYVNGTTSPEQGTNFGYPTCYAAWNVSAIPNNTGLQVGSQFAIGTPNATFNDTLDRTDPVGYKLSVVQFANGSPVDPSNSTTAAVDIVSNRDNSACPNGCFRPVGLAWDTKGRLYMSSDATGEIYVVVRSDGNATSSAGSSSPSSIPSASGSAGPSGTGSAVTATSTKAAAGKNGAQSSSALAIAMGLIYLLF
ncbi:hypothetical protein LTR04_005480 [Oleoguttula sp. CCFEE 6159]|nr:hypothetical protein LTR04_005480 [Oleoguttula sp. CCFEE 6159]